MPPPVTAYSGDRHRTQQGLTVGTRLYPCTDDVSKLERVAGAKPGTERFLKMYKGAERLYTEPSGHSSAGGHPSVSVGPS